MAPTQEATKPVQFITKHANLRLVVKAASRTLNIHTGEAFNTPEVAVEFNAGGYETSDQETIDWLRAHEDIDSAGVGGFTEVTDVVIVPDSAPVLAKITELLIAGDVDGIADIALDEQKGHGRTDVTESAHKALAALEPEDAA